MILGREYSSAGGSVVSRYRVFFMDDGGREFHRVVGAASEAEAVGAAMAQDRRSGGGSITFVRIE